MHSSGPVGRHRQLVLVLEGELYLVPFALLKGSASNEYLYERFTLIAVPAVRSLGPHSKVTHCPTLGSPMQPGGLTGLAPRPRPRAQCIWGRFCLGGLLSNYVSQEAEGKERASGVSVAEYRSQVGRELVSLTLAGLQSTLGTGWQKPLPCWQRGLALLITKMLNTQAE